MFLAQIKLSLLNRYIISQLNIFFWFSLAIFSIVGVAIGAIGELINNIFENDLPVSIAIEILILKFPEFLCYALPISVLLTTLVTYGRLNSNSELIALRSIGVSIYRFIVPALILSLVVVSISFFVNELVVPAANYQANVLGKRFINTREINWQKKDIFSPEYEANIIANKSQNKRLKRLIYVEGFDGNKLHDVIVLNWSQERLNQIIFSDLVQWNEQEQVWDFFNGLICNFSSNSQGDSLKKFTHQKFNISRTSFELIIKERDPYKMNIFQAKKYLKILQDIGDEKGSLLLQVRIQQKIAFPFICLIFGLIGSVLGASNQSINRAKSWGMCVAIAFSYYLFSFLIGALGIVNILSPVIAAWLPNFLGLGIGGWLLIKNAQ